MSVKPAYIYAGVAVAVIVALSIALIVVTATATPAAALRGAIPHNQRMARQNMQDAIAHHRRLNMQQHQPVMQHQHQPVRRPQPVRLNTASIHTEPLPPVREQHNFNVRFGQSREPLRNMMASDNEGAHLSSAIWNRESLIRKHKVIS
jgi:hypothetical protein